MKNFGSTAYRAGYVFANRVRAIVDTLRLSRPRWEARNDDEGGLDELYVTNPQSVHLERMSNDCWSLIVTINDGLRLRTPIYRKGRQVLAFTEED